MPSETERQPAEPSTPDAQPAKVRLAPFATSAFQGGPGGVEERSGSKLTLDSVIVIVPAEPVFKSPTTAADATAPNDATASHARRRITVTRRCICATSKRSSSLNTLPRKEACQSTRLRRLWSPESAITQV